MNEEGTTIKDLVILFSTLGLLISVFMLIGILGGLDQDKITFAEAVKKSIIWMAICAASVVGIIRGEEEEEWEK